MDKSHLLPAKSFPLCGGEAVGPQHLALVSPKRKHIVHREKPWVSYFTQKIILKHSLNQQKDASASAFTLILPSADWFYGCFLNSTSVLIWEVGGWGGLKEQVATATSCSNLQSPTGFFLTKLQQDRWAGFRQWNPGSHNSTSSYFMGESLLWQRLFLPDSVQWTWMPLHQPKKQGAENQEIFHSKTA